MMSKQHYYAHSHNSKLPRSYSSKLTAIFFSSSTSTFILLQHPPPSSLPHPPRRMSTRGYRRILHLLDVPDQSAQWDPGGRTCYPTSSTVHSSNILTATFLSLSTSTQKNGHSWLWTHLTSLYCTRPVLAAGWWRTALLCNPFKGSKITERPLIQYASVFYDRLDRAQLSNNILASPADPCSSEVSSLKLLSSSNPG